MSKEMLPKERCEFKEKRVCQEVEGSTCRPVSKKICEHNYTGKPYSHSSDTVQSERKPVPYSFESALKSRNNGYISNTNNYNSDYSKVKVNRKYSGP